MATGTITSISSVATKSILSNVRNGYSAVMNDGDIVCRKYGNGMNIINFQMKASSAISSGYVDLSSVLYALPKQQQVHCALTGSNGKTGWVQLTADGKMYIRCEQTGNDTYLCGQMVY